MENLQKEAKEAGNETPKLPLTEELLSKVKYDIAPEAFLNPKNRIEGFNVTAQYQEMLGDAAMKILHSRMTDEEINAAVAEAVAEYEAPLVEEAAQETDQLMEQVTAENQKEVALTKEHKLSPLSRAIEIFSTYFSKNKTVAQAMTVLSLVLEFASYAPEVEAHGLSTGQRIGITALYGMEAAVRNETHGTQRASEGAQRSAVRVENAYQNAIRAENARYRRTLAQLGRQAADPRRQHQIYRQTHALSQQTAVEEQQWKLDQLHRQFQVALNKGDTLTSTQIRRQIESVENAYVQEQRDSVERSAKLVEGEHYDQGTAAIESQHQEALRDIKEWYNAQMDNIDKQYGFQMQRVHQRTGNIQMNTGFRMLNEGIWGSIRQQNQRHHHR